ncbi:MAG: YceI family protein [Gemmatimonadaceae bacterium]
MTRLFRYTLATVLAATLGASASAQPNVHSWNIDPNHTAAQFAVKHLLVSTVRGHFEKVSGTIQYDGNDVRTLSVHVTIEAASVNTRVQMRDNDLRSANFFDVDKYPTITFVSKKAEHVDDGAFKLTGDLTIHGVTREVVLDVEGPMVPVKQGATIRTGASATTKINRRDFGLLYGRVIEAAPIVGDEVTITIDVEAVRPAD